MAESRPDRIQQMLISRLEKQIEELKRKNEELMEKLQKMKTESVAKIYLLEEERDAAQHSIRQLEEDLALERSKMRKLRQGAGNGRKKR